MRLLGQPVDQLGDAVVPRARAEARQPAIAALFIREGVIATLVLAGSASDQKRVDVARAQAIAEVLTVRRAAADAWIATWAADHEVHALEQLREQARLAAKLARARAGGDAGSLTEA